MMKSDISLIIAFSGGLLSFLSPCIFPMIPSYLSLLLGNYAEEKENKNVLLPSLLFVIGFSFVFIIMGMSASYLGQLLLNNIIILRKISGVIVIILGLHLSGVIKLKFLYHEKGLEISNNVNIYLRALLMGIALAFAWTPCIGPILSSILIYAGTSQTVFQGGLLLAFYSLGFALPFLLTALLLDWLLPKFKKVNTYLPLIQKLTGIFLIILGILIYTNQLQIFTQF